MLAKVFQIDVTQCQHCKGDMAIIAAITNHSEVARYLKHLGIEHEPPAGPRRGIKKSLLSLALSRIDMKPRLPLITEDYGPRGALLKA